MNKVKNTKIKPRSTTNDKYEKFESKINQLYPGKYILLSNYVKSTDRIKVQYAKCGHIGFPKASYLIQGAGCPQCNRGTKLTEEEFLERFSEIAGDEFVVLDEYQNTKQNIHIKHKKCGTVFSRNITNIFKTKHCYCPKCCPVSAKQVVFGVNDVYTVSPDMVDFFKNPEDAKKFTPMSSKKCEFKCPVCGYEEIKTVAKVSTYGFNCKICNCNNSYGERFMASLLLELGIPFIPQFSPEWAHGYRYDFQLFEDLIVEIDGGWHYTDNGLSGRTVDEQSKIDLAKEDLAKKNGYRIIRIDYNYHSDSNRTEYIINSILQSDLCSLIGIDSSFSFQNTINRVSTPMVKQVADLWNSYKEKYSWYIMKELNLSDSTVRNLLTQAYTFGLIKESPEEVKTINLHMSSKVHGHSKATKVRCNETGEVFMQIKDANRKYHASIGSYFRDDNRKYSGTLPDGTRLTWTKIA